MKILVVDDFPSMRRILRNLLNKIGISDIDEASDGAEAFAKLQTSKFDLVISDWNMEPITGLDLLRRVRSDAGISSMPFIMVTAESKTENVIEAKKAGVNNYIVKPFTADVLKAKIAANNWDGSIPQAYDIWVSAFGAESILLIQDNQDMSMVVAIAGQRLDTIEQALLVNGYIPLKPEGVKVNYYAVVPSDGTLMAWDVTPNAALAGWDSGQWATELIPA